MGAAHPPPTPDPPRTKANPVNFLLALILSALCPVWQPTPAPVAPMPDIVTVAEHGPVPNVAPPTRLDVILAAPDATMLARCDAMGGVLADEAGRCADVDY